MAIVDGLTLQEKVGQLLMVPPDRRMLKAVHAGTVIVGGDLLGEDVEQARSAVADLQDFNAGHSRIPLWIHGFVSDRSWAGPLGRQIVERYTVEQAEDAFFDVGKTCRYMGVHTYPAPTVNVPVFGDCIMHEWAMSEDPDEVVRYARAVTRGLTRARCGSMAQHFPAHGATAADSHQDVPVIELDLDELLRVHIPPYAASFEAGCTTICTAHLRCPALDPDEGNIATTSRAILTDFLRGQLGFRGVTIADGVSMAGFQRMGDTAETCVVAVAAGCDSICMVDWDDTPLQVFDELVRACRDSRLRADRLDEAVRRNIDFKRWLGLI